MSSSNLLMHSSILFRCEGASTYAHQDAPHGFASGQDPPDSEGVHIDNSGSVKVGHLCTIYVKNECCLFCSFLDCWAHWASWASWASWAHFWTLEFRQHDISNTC